MSADGWTLLIAVVGGIWVLIEAARVALTAYIWCQRRRLARMEHA